MSEDPLDEFAPADNPDQEDSGKVAPPVLPGPYAGMSDARALRAFALTIQAQALGHPVDAEMLVMVASAIEAKIEKRPLPEKWSTVLPGQMSPALKRRFIDLVGEERLRELSVSDHRVMDIERQIRETEAEVTGKESNVAVAWQKCVAAKRDYFAEHEWREKQWKKIVYLRQLQRSRIEDVMRNELSARVDKIRSKINVKMSSESSFEHRRAIRDRRGNTRMVIVPPDATIPQQVLDSVLAKSTLNNQ